MTATSAQGAEEGTPMRRVATASAVGTTIEFYDFFIYGTAAALVFPAVFFPALGTAAGTVASFATYAVAFGARPLGAIIFGHFGDRLGRKRTLVSTLLMMGVATVLIGVLPSASAIGVAAPIILVVLRVVQGLAVGGEWAGAVLLAAEYAPAHRRGFYAVFPQLGPPIAFAMSSATFLAVNVFVGETSQAFVIWGWRVPFLASALLVLVGLYVRLKVDETPVFTRLAAQREAGTRSPILSVFRDQPRELLLAGGALAMMFAFFYMGTAYLTSYGTTVMGLHRGTVLAIGLAGSAVFFVAIVISGIYSDRVGRRRVVIGSCVAAIAWSLVLIPILDRGSGMAFFIALGGTLGIMGLSYGPAGALLPEMFEARYRYTGAGMSYAIAAVVGGGTAPIIATKLVEAGHVDGIGWMLAAFGLGSLLCMIALPETQSRGIGAVDDTVEEVAA